MKKAFFIFLLLLSCAVSLAQSAFNINLMNGDVKMKEHFYEMALSYYQKALSASSSAEESAVAEQRIKECQLAMAPPKAEDNSARSKKTKLLFSEQFLETGHVYDEAKEAIVPYPDEGNYPSSLYQIDVYRNALVIISHKDQVSSQEMNDISAGTVIPLAEETDSYRVFSSGQDGETFIVFKKNQGNFYGQNRIIFREQDDMTFVLYPIALVKQKMSESSSQSSDDSEVSDKPEDSHKDPVTIYPITFTENWQLNLDKDGQRLGDNRTAPLNAKEVCWLMFRFRYTCPETFTDSLRFDFKLLDPSGNLLVFPGEGTKSGYSSSSVLETIPGGGIFNIIVGSDSPGSFAKGRYTISLWCENVEYYSVVIELE